MAPLKEERIVPAFCVNTGVQFAPGDGGLHPSEAGTGCWRRLSPPDDGAHDELSQPERSPWLLPFTPELRARCQPVIPPRERQREAFQVICSQAEALQEAAYGQHWYFYQDVKQAMRVDSFAWLERCILQILRLSASVILQLPEKNSSCARKRDTDALMMVKVQ